MMKKPCIFLFLVFLALVLMMQFSEGEDKETIGIGTLKPRIAMTFDDGPHPIYTSRLLDGLKERNVKATFFVIGKQIEGNEEIIERMYKEGHLIGNHTYNHVSLSGLNDEQACEELLKTCRVLHRITGNYTEFIRPPFGEWDERLDCKVNMIPVLWDVDPRDWRSTNVSKVVNKVVTDVKENDIILLHDYYDTSVQAALEIVDALQEEGYEFVTVDQLILD